MYSICQPYIGAVKTNAARILDSLGIAYELREYDVDPADLSAETVARKIAMPLDQVWKTLVARGDRHGVCLAVVPASGQLQARMRMPDKNSNVRCRDFIESPSEATFSSYRKRRGLQ